MSFDVAWCVFCNVLFKKYSDTWIKASPVGHIGDLSIEEYTKLCYDESLISENDKESQAMYIYYLCSIKDSYGISLPDMNLTNQVYCSINKAKLFHEQKSLENRLFGSKNKTIGK